MPAQLTIVLPAVTVDAFARCTKSNNYFDKGHHVFMAGSSLSSGCPLWGKSNEHPQDATVAQKGPTVR
jgi:hypothetical protein